MTTGLSADIRSVTTAENCIKVRYQGDSKVSGGFQGVSVLETWSLNGPRGNYLDWTIEVTNQKSDSMDVEDFGLPLPFNSYWGNNQTENYEQRVHRHSFIPKHGSYIYWQRPNGDGHLLALLPHHNTSLEFSRVSERRRREKENLFGENLPQWEGLTVFYIHSEHVASNKVDNAAQDFSSSCLTLAPGQSRTYGFNFA
ncbi:hypothetical protein V2G26_014776 [Clonostachys chloroleuca]